MSLKSNLNQIIKDRKGEILTYNELKAYCEKAQYKLSNAERRLRPSDSPNIERVMKNGAITGYRYLEPGPDGLKPQQSGDIAPNKQIRQYASSKEEQIHVSPDCCYSFQRFKTHDPKCKQNVRQPAHLNFKEVRPSL